MPVPGGHIAWALASAAAAVAMATDLARGKVYNWLTAPVAAAGLALSAAAMGPRGLAISALGLAAGLGAGLLAAVVGARFGGGDIKLLSALGALLGPSALLHVGLVAVFAGGAMALALAALRGQLWASVKALATFLSAKAAGLRPIKLSDVSAGVGIPFAAAVAAGVWVSWLDVLLP